MRDIMFRGKKLMDGEWVKAHNIMKFNDGAYGISQDYGGHTYIVDPATIGQYTGLRDVNGKEIYEGDILDIEGGLEDYYYVVEWVFSGFQLVTYKKPDSNVRGISHGLNQGYFEESDGCEVIGNIHDNPELLGVVS